MSLTEPELDERDFQDLVDEAKRLIPKYCPEWTNHNLSDPGVALIELFAWMSDIMLYRLNQMPDRFYTKFLELVGIRPFAASAAKTDLTFWLSSDRAESGVIPAGTEVSTQASDGVSPVVFATAADLTITQAILVAALTAPPGVDPPYTDVWDALRFELEGVVCFTSNPIKSGDALYLGFESSLAGNVIRIDLGATSVEGIGIKPESPPVRWEVWDGAAWYGCDVVKDTTGGLNQQGSVTLVVPIRHEAVTLGPQRAYWLRVVLIHPEPGQSGYKASPVLHGVDVVSLGGTVTAEHSRVVGEEVLGRSNGEPGQTFAARHTPVLARRETETVVVRDRGREDTWIEVDDFTRSTETDLHFTWDDASGVVSFGPRVRLPDVDPERHGKFRQYGAVPPAGAEIVVTGYRTGGGSAGNVGADTLTALQSSFSYIARVTNQQPAFGGVDPETIDNAKVRGPLTLRTGQRAVTASDFVRLTHEASPAVHNARCLPPIAAGKPVRILVVPKLDKPAHTLTIDDFTLREDLVATIAAHLDERRLLGATVEISTPYYQGVTIAALVDAVAGRPPAVVRQRVLDALYAYVNPLTGGPHGAGWGFDVDLNAATLFELIDAIDGVDRVRDVLLFEYDLRTHRRHGPGRDIMRLADNSLFLSAAHQVVVTK